MVVETWVMPLANVSTSFLAEFSILRLLRLLRITRIAKLMRAFPQLMMIIKGITCAVKAVTWTAILLVGITYTWAILFTNEYHQGKSADDDVPGGTAEELFGSMGKSMQTLIVMGTILDDITACTDSIRGSKKYHMLFFFLLYIVINSFMMMNMLVGILVEVVGSTAEGEKRRMLEEEFHNQISELFRRLDQDGNKTISKQEFEKVRLEEPAVMKSLSDIGIQEKEFEMYLELSFQPDEEGNVPGMRQEELEAMILNLKPGNPVSALDFAAFQQIVVQSQRSMKEQCSRIEDICCMLVGETPMHDVNSAGEDVITPFAGKDGCGINMNLLAKLQDISSSEIVGELGRRLGMADLEETGVPLSMMDEELQTRVKATEAFQTLGAPHSDHEWSPETLTC